MTETERLADTIALLIHEAIVPMQRDIAALKAVAAIPGPPGPAGTNGKDGLDGLNGKDGAPGLAGKDGSDGLAGKDGATGLPGTDGLAGLNGKDGAAGLNGKDGLDAVLDPVLLSGLTKRLDAVEIKAAFAQRIERDVEGLKHQVLETKSADDLTPERIAAILAEELAALGAPSWPS